MIVTLAAPAEALLREQVASGQFSSVDSAVEAAVQTVFGHRASQALESLLDEALLNPGRRVPVSELRRKQAGRL
jgi:Arc/MetJ-type ribon-helix-helix transcriptional regulator